MRVRITGHANTRDVKHIATVLKVWKQNPAISATDTLTLVQLTERNEIEPYRRIGRSPHCPLGTPDCYETSSALAAGDAVLREVQAR